jgi:peptide/nickel transport system substrate-binding protein
MARRIFWLFGSVALLLSLMTTSVAAAGPEGSQAPRRGGTLIFGAEQEPSDSLNGVLACCNLAWASWTVGNLALRGAFQVQPNFTYKPYTISRAVVQTNPFRVTYHIRPNATWTEGNRTIPITAADFIFTWQTYINPRNDMASRAGYEDIRRGQRINNKTVRFTFKQPYAAWRDLFSGPYGILPAFALRGEDFNKAWESALTNPKNGRPIANGPFLFQSYQRGSQMTWVRNPRFWGGPGNKRANLDRIVFRFLTNTNTEIQQMRGGEVDAIYPQPQLALAELRRQSGIRVITNAGTTWEHIDFQFGPKGHPALRRPYVRQAIARGINRPAIVRRLFGSISPNLRVLQNAIYMSNQPEYQPHYQRWGYNPATGRQLLTRNRCTRGGDGIFSCPGVGRLSFSLKTTLGNQRRALVFEIAQATLKDVGIELRFEPYRAAIVFGDEHLSGHNYDLALFAWVGSPDPGGYVEIARCGGDQNYQTYCNRRATRLLDQSHRILNPRNRARILNQADTIIAGDLFQLPMYQLPTFLAYKSTRVRGMTDNPTQEGFPWSAELWWLAR